MSALLWLKLEVPFGLVQKALRRLDPSMSSSTITAHESPGQATRDVSVGFIPVILLLGGVINGFAVRVVESIRLNGVDTLLFGISPFELIAAGVAAHLLITTARTSDFRPGWPEAVVLILFLLPSSTVAWIGVTLYGAWRAYHVRGEERVGAVLFSALGMTALWASVFMNWLAAPITTVEAHLVTSLLHILRDDVSVSANLMGVIGGHQVLLLPACASAYLIPKAIVALAALTVFMGAKLELRCFIKLALSTVVVLTLLNWVRLAIMTMSYELYELAHGPIGANLFDLTQTAIIIAAGMWASR